MARVTQRRGPSVVVRRISRAALCYPPGSVSQLPLPLAPPPPPEGARAVPRRAKIHVNRNLRLDALSAVGFDMDYTLAIYRQSEMDRLQIDVTVQKLVERGHPSSLLDIAYPTDFAIRGLHVDKKLGNVLKMDRYRYVKRGYHGMREIARDERRRLYSQKPVQPGTKRYHWVDTLYVLPEVSVFSAAVEHLEASGRVVDYAALFDDVRKCIDLAHQDGSVVEVIARDPERFVERDPLLPIALERLRASGKKVFVVTNSSARYTATILAYLLDDPARGITYRSYFDAIVCASKKPRFFTEPELAIEPAEEGLAAPNGTLEPGRLYQGGCLAELERYLGESGDEILYVGDHIYGDVLRAKKESAWRTMMIVQEMGAELDAHDRVAAELARLDELFEVGEILHDELRMHQAQLRAVEESIATAPERVPSSMQGARITHRRALERVKVKLAALDAERDLLEDGVERAYHPYWGSLFKAGSEVSSLGDQVEQYACLYTDRVSNLVHYGPSHYFRGPRDRMPHEL